MTKLFFRKVLGHVGLLFQFLGQFYKNLSLSLVVSSKAEPYAFMLQQLKASKVPPGVLEIGDGW